MPSNKVAPAERPAAGFSTRAKPAPSPIEMPSRSTSKGRQGSREVSSSERKPYSVVRHSVSAPPTTAASQTPAAIMRAALPNTFEVEEQADDTTSDGPLRSRLRRTKSPSE